uniref:HLA class II histocompatibility antigen, DQ beta 2 chain-like n=1 Tax=Labrus bergylta TaxID=56723 RepID=A0A3Q3FK33_9LABR
AHWLFEVYFLITLLLSNALYANALLNCVFTSTNDVVYLGQLFINKVLWGEYNSTVGKYVGFTEKGRQIAEEVNKNPSFLKQEKKNLEKCKTHVPVAMEILSKAVEPSVRLRAFDATDSKHPRMLVCSVYNFYPKQINVRWLRNGKEVTSDVTSTEELPNGNWLYQMHSYLEMTPRAGEKIACMVEHASFQKPKLYEWGKRVTESVRCDLKIPVGLSGDWPFFSFCAQL